MFALHRSAQFLTLVTLAATYCVSPALAIDQVQTARGTLSGTLREMTPREINLERTGGKIESIPVNEVQYVRFDGEPPQMNLVRNAVLNGRYEEAWRDLEKVGTDTSAIKREELKQDIEFYRAYAAAQLALAGNGEIATAGRQLREFAQKYPNNFHAYQTSQALGDLLVAIGRYDDALTQYAQLGEAPWPDYKMRAAVARGQAYARQNKYPEAEREYAAATEISKNATGPLVDVQRASATLGLAECQAKNGKVDEAIKLVEEIIAAADPEMAELHARAFNTLGGCYLSAERNKEALLAYLRVDLLYSNVPQAHAESLHYLAQLWQAVGKSDHAATARETLQQRYANSPWNK
ncbi:MAG: tetratricopeptide repeat protein [Pirellulales bacterium]|nr:tetratricopeptide repeat protein [Pirellulales bacterium]